MEHGVPDGGGTARLELAIAIQRDARPDSTRPLPLRQPLLPATDELKETSSLPGYRAIANRHQTMAATRFEFLRQMVFQSHYALIRLSKSGTDITLHQVMVSQSELESPTGAENTIHDVLLSPSKDPAPTLTTRGGTT